MVTIESIVKRELRSFINEVEIEPSDVAVDNICKSEKFCSAQGKITFGQLKAIVDSATKKRIFVHLGEGGYKATLRLLPWFIPQIAFAGVAGSITRAINKIIRPALESTESYKTWWGKAIMKSFDVVEGEIGVADPLSKIFFISDGLMTLLNEKYKIKFARYIAELASEQPDDTIVPDYFVENELRKWLNEKFLLNPPLPPKKIESNVEGLPFNQEMKEGYKFRTFKPTIKSEELKWHFDDQDREVTILESNGWEIQFDNQIPKLLKENDVIFIPKGMYHRVIKGNGDLKIKIIEY